MGAGAKIGMKVMSMAIGIPVSIAARKTVERLWTAARPAEPPREPDDAGVNWSDAVGWAVLSAAGIVVAELVTRRGAEATWRAVTGTEPPPPPKTKAQKKLEKAQNKLTDED